MSDSAGVRLIEFDADQLPERWRVVDNPAWVIGAPSGIDILLHDVQDARMISDGRVAIAEQSSQTIVLVDLEEEEVRRLGGPGEGPGEFTSLHTLFEEDDGIAAYDLRLRRYSVLDLDGREVRSEVLATRGGGAPDVTRSGDGALFTVSVNGFPDGPTESYRAAVPVVQVLPVEDTVTTTKGVETYWNDEGLGWLSFGATSVIAGAQEGVWVGDTAVPEAQLWVGGEAPHTIVRWNDSRVRTISVDRRMEYIENLLDRSELSAEERAHSREILAARPFSPELPAFEELQVSIEGDLWIRTLVPQDMASPPHVIQQDWFVIPASGEPKGGRVRMPQGFRLSFVHGDGVIGVHQDEIGIETVRGYRIIPTDAERGAQ